MEPDASTPATPATRRAGTPLFQVDRRTERDGTDRDGPCGSVDHGHWGSAKHPETATS